MKGQQGGPFSPWGHPLVEDPLFCVLTRVHLRSVWSLPLMFFMYLKVRREARQVPYLKRSAFLVGGLRTFFILSIWDCEDGLLMFGTIANSHINAIRRSTCKAQVRNGSKEIWSTEWRIRAVSNNLKWEGPEDWSYIYGDELTHDSLGTVDRTEDTESGIDKHRI